MPAATTPPLPPPPPPQEKKEKRSGDSANPYVTTNIKYENALDLSTWLVPNYLSVSY